MHQPSGPAAQHNQTPAQQPGAQPVTPPVTPDAVRGSWVERMPEAWQPYLRLARLDRPIGTWLLLLPCWWSVTLATRAAGGDWPDPVLLLLFAIGAVAMRGAGCAYNDIVDRDIDAQVARTRSRPLPSGQVSLRQAWGWLVALCLVGLGVLLALQPTAQLVALGSLVLVAGYPFMKRITWWPQAWLGLTFNWGALVGWAAVSGTVPLPALLLYAAGIFWTLGYDTIYALQDVEDDALVGVRSSARRLGAQARQGIGAFYALTAVLLTAAFWTAGFQSLWLLVPAFLHLAWQIYALVPADSAVCLRLFRANRDCGLLIWLACLLAA